MAITTTSPASSPTVIATASTGLGSSLTVLVLWLMSIWDVHMSTEQAIALVTIIGSLAGWIWQIARWWLAKEGIPVPDVALAGDKPRVAGAV